MPAFLPVFNSTLELGLRDYLSMPQFWERWVTTVLFLAKNVPELESVKKAIIVVQLPSVVSPKKRVFVGLFNTNDEEFDSGTHY